MHTHFVLLVFVCCAVLFRGARAGVNFMVDDEEVGMGGVDGG